MKKVKKPELKQTTGLGCLVAPEWSVQVNPAEELGPIKCMNAVNNGPMKGRSDQTCSFFDEYAALKIPYARLHDSALCHAYGGPHSVDITAVFPDWDADETLPESYDFVCTDEYLASIRAAGTEPYYRLGQSIEHFIKKYGVRPPKDNAKWARICEHIVRHYNEGWANGYHWNIRYWEIWNEPDGNRKTPDGREGPTWTGTREEFFELYRVTSLHLRACFGNTIKIGGAGFICWKTWEPEFLPFCRENNLPLDFYSWHRYYFDVTDPAMDAWCARDLLDRNGFTQTESHLNEWNYVKGWGEDWVYSLECESGRYAQKGAASVAAVMVTCQDAPLDMLMFYDARIGTGMNNLFDSLTLLPLKGYYPFLAWRRLVELGTQVETVVETKDLEKPQLFVCAAKNAAGKIGVLVVRYSDDNNIIETRRVKLSLAGGPSVDWDSARCHITDAVRTYTEAPLKANEDGTATLKLQPNSFAFIEV